MRRLLSLLPALAVLTVACTAAPGAPRPSPPSVAPGPSSSDAADASLRVSTADCATDFAKHEIPLDAIISGGPGKDGIPAIDEPEFLPVDRVDWLVEREPVIAFGIGDDWRAYPSPDPGLARDRHTTSWRTPP